MSADAQGQACDDCGALPGRDHSSACLMQLEGTRALVATGFRLGFELGKAEGRKQAGEEIAQAIKAQVGDGEWAGDYYRKAAQIAREIASQPAGEAPGLRTASPERSGPPEDSQALSIHIPRGEG